MRALLALLAFAATLAADAACAQAGAPAVTSAGPDSVSVSIYRAPYRDAKDELELEWLQGYALVTETRTVTIPQGRAVIRFEGVAGRILPESAIVTGLPEGVREKNMDADLLSERSLYARSLNRPVTIRRVLGGKVIEERAILRSGADGAAIFETAEGFIAADCRQPEQIVYDGVPGGLSAKPTLSVETESPRSGRVTLTLSYLAWGYDWQANYVATMRPDGKSADLFAWVTLANGDVTSFENAQAMVIAGRPNREDGEEPELPDAEPLAFRCFAAPVSDLAAQDAGAFPEGMVMAMPAPARMRMAADDIVVTGSRVSQEDLGDLKLYRVPHATTVAAMSQKQVAMLDQPSVPVEVIHRADLGDEAGDVRLLLRAQNKKEKGLGLPLPAGPVAVFEPRDGQRLLIGEGSVADKAIGEEVDIEIADATQVTAEVEAGDKGGNWQAYVATVSNANPHPVRFEGRFPASPWQKVDKVSTRLKRKNGRDLWVVEIPANSTVTLRYRITDLSN
ncbi:MAG: hypothetical protein EOP61_14990 [Sphingomonadales bacterium]|nr:MAG: hypothetical protein EOP61_14990 [Sphingomonadales bacterium]